MTCVTNRVQVHKRIIADPVGMEQLQPDQSLLPHLRTFRRSEEEASASKVDRNVRVSSPACLKTGETESVIVLTDHRHEAEGDM